MPVRYLHLADLHLDAPLKGLALRQDACLASIADQATFAACDRFFALAKRVRPDFVLLAGDLANSEEKSIRARLTLMRHFRKMGELGIPVFLVHGNHDPLPQAGQTLPYPDCVTVFGSHAGSKVLCRDGRPYCIVHGVSFAERSESRNLTLGFSRGAAQGENAGDAPNDAAKDAFGDCLQVGLLHCSLEGAGGEGRYAPCQVADLVRSGLDAWALGHIHKPSRILGEPLVLYPGSPQGLDISEDGPHGCALVEAMPDPVRPGAWQCQAWQVPLAPVRWETVRCDLTGIGDADEADALAMATVDALVERLLADSGKTVPLGPAGENAPSAALPAGYPVRALLVRILFVGATRLDAPLREKLSEHEAAIAAQLASAYPGDPAPLAQEGSGRIAVRLKDICLATSGVDEESERARDDLLGAGLGLLAAMEASPDILCEVAGASLGELCGKPDMARLLREALPELAPQLQRMHANAARTPGQGIGRESAGAGAYADAPESANGQGAIAPQNAMPAEQDAAFAAQGLAEGPEQGAVQGQNAGPNAGAEGQAGDTARALWAEIFAEARRELARSLTELPGTERRRQA